MISYQAVIAMLGSHGKRDIADAMPITMLTDGGHFGGIPAGGMQFCNAHNAAAHLTLASMADFGHGGGADIAFISMGQVQMTQ